MREREERGNRSRDGERERERRELGERRRCCSWSLKPAVDRERERERERLGWMAGSVYTQGEEEEYTE